MQYILAAGEATIKAKDKWNIIEGMLPQIPHNYTIGIDSKCAFVMTKKRTIEEGHDTLIFARIVNRDNSLYIW